MFSKLKRDEESDATTFYSPISASGYLTPIQRKKLREKRNIDISSFNEDFVTPKTKKKVKKALHRNIKPHPKVQNSKKGPRQKRKKENSPEIRIASDLLVQKNPNDSKEKKFFKSRSPQHLKKANYVVSVKNKRRRLDFNSSVNQDSLLVKKQCKNASPKNNSDIALIKTTNIFDIDQNCNISPEAGISKPLKYVTERICLNPNKDMAYTEHDVKENIELDFYWPSDEYLLERQNRARAAIKQARSILMSDIKLHVKEDPEKVQDKTTSPPKLYSIFTKAVKQEKNEDEEEKTFATKRPIQKKSPSRVKKYAKSDDDQMIIDAGQKEIGAKICQTCNMIYFLGQEEDEQLHSKYHDTYLTSLKFPGWKNENVVGEYADGRILLIKETDKNFKLKKVKDVLFIANRDLGFPTAGFPTRPNVMFLLFISNEKRISGCLVAESIHSACPVVAGEAVSEEGKKTVWKLGNWYASSKTIPALCGINRIWVSRDFRRHKVASRMVDCLRQYFIFGHVVSLAEIAFTDPSPDGREFAASYTGTNHFLVYK